MLVKDKDWSVTYNETHYNVLWKVFESFLWSRLWIERPRFVPTLFATKTGPDRRKQSPSCSVTDSRLNGTGSLVYPVHKFQIEECRIEK